MYRKDFKDNQEEKEGEKDSVYNYLEREKETEVRSQAI